MLTLLKINRDRLNEFKDTQECREATLDFNIELKKR